MRLKRGVAAQGPHMTIQDSPLADLTVQTALQVDQWRNYVLGHPQGNIFHTPEMFEVFSRTKHHEPQLWTVVDDSGTIQALFTPVIVTLAGGVVRRLTTRSVSYGGLLFEPTTSGTAALAILLQEYRRQVGRRALFSEVRHLSDMRPAQPVLTSHGFAYEDHLNYLLDLDLPIEQVFDNIGHRTRKAIRAGIRKGEVQVEEVQQRSALDDLYAILCKTYSRNRVPLADRSLFEAAFEVLVPTGSVKFWLARLDGRVVAGSAELVFKETMYGWYGGVDRAYSSHQPGALLMWHVLNWGATHGMAVYDFGGAGRPDEEYGVREFKAKFGGELVSFGRNRLVHAPTLLQLSTIGYGLYRSIYRP